MGHAAGDEVIRLCARRLLEQTPAGCLVARLGGDEFVVVAPEPDGNEALALADRLIQSLNLPYRIDGHNLTIGASIGIALLPGDGEDAEELLRHADRALYRAKAEGRNRACLFGADAAAGPGDHAPVSDRQGVGGLDGGVELAARSGPARAGRRSSSPSGRRTARGSRRRPSAG